MKNDPLSRGKAQSARLVIAYDREPAKASQTPSQEKVPPRRLSVREHEVLHLLTQGQTNREIATNLMVSVGTVKIHVEHILAKLGVSDRTQAAVCAIELGLLHAPSKE